MLHQMPPSWRPPPSHSSQASQPGAGSRRCRLIEDRDTFEKNRLQNRTGGYYNYVDSAEILRPDPTSTHFINETDRFQKDFNVKDQTVRENNFNKNQDKIHKLRKERLNREEVRFQGIDKTLAY